MRARTVIYLVVLLLLAVLVIANWSGLTTLIELNLIVTRAFIPAAVLVLGLLGLLALINWSFHAAHRLEWHRRQRALEAEIQRLRAELTRYAEHHP
jgi:uncharacterized integral membrane protein